MLHRSRSWLRAPFHEDPAEQLRATVLHRLLLVGVATVLLAIVFVLVTGRPFVPSGFVYALSLGAGLLGLLLVRRGWNRVAGGLTISAVWGLVLGVSVLQGGVQSPQISSIVLVVMLAGLLWGRRGMLALAALSSLSILGIEWAALEGMITPTLPAPDPLVVWVALTIILVLSAAYMYMALGQLDRARIAAAETADRLRHEMQRREESERSLRRAERLDAVGRLAGGVAHDFNNALTVVLGNVELLATDAARDPAFREECIDAIRGAADDASQLTSQLLAFGRPDIGQPGAVDVGHALEEMGPMLRRLVPESITIGVGVARDLTPVLIDRTRFQQIVVNLVLNARDAMPEGGEIRIDAGPVGPGGGTRRELGADRRRRAHRRRRHGPRRSGGGPGRDLRSVLHDQEARQGHRPRSRDRARHREPGGWRRGRSLAGRSGGRLRGDPPSGRGGGRPCGARRADPGPGRR